MGNIGRRPPRKKTETPVVKKEKKVERAVDIGAVTPANESEFRRNRRVVPFALRGCYCGTGAPVNPGPRKKIRTAVEVA